MGSPTTDHCPLSTALLSCLPSHKAFLACSSWFQYASDMTPNAQTIDSLLEQVVSIAEPLRVVLFGSAARGDWGETSDIDMLVIVPNGAHTRAISRHLYGSIRGVQVPFDLVVTTPDILQKHAQDSGMVYRHALREGMELYAA